MIGRVITQSDRTKWVINNVQHYMISKSVIYRAMSAHGNIHKLYVITYEICTHATYAGGYRYYIDSGEFSLLWECLLIVICVSCHSLYQTGFYINCMHINGNAVILTKFVSLALPNDNAIFVIGGSCQNDNFRQRRRLRCHFTTSVLVSHFSWISHQRLIQTVIVTNVGYLSLE